MSNIEIAEIFEKIAAILEIQNANQFRVRAYEQAAVLISGLSRELKDIYQEGGKKAIDDLPGIGADLSAKIEEMILTGRLKYFLQLKKQIPTGLLQVEEIEGMGPRRTKLVFEKFGVKNLKDLEKLLTSGKLKKVSGWGEKSAANIKLALAQYRGFGARRLLAEVLPVAEEIVAILKTTGLAKQIEIAGSLRRRKETIGDIDLLATSTRPEKLIDFFSRLPQVKRVLAQGPTKCLVILKNGLDCDLRVLDPREFGAGLYYFTGSKAHNIAARTLAVQNGLTISEYGVFKGTKEKKGRRLAGRTEQEIFKILGLDYIEPELRENTGEIEAARTGSLPHLIKEEDIKGDLHTHSNWSDGANTILEMAGSAQAKGWEYLAICDHASPMGMVGGIKQENYKKYIQEARLAEKKIKDFHVLAGAEVDILRDGSMYLPDKILQELDWVLAAAHGSFKMGKQEMTQRVIRALENPYVHGLAHPTTRILQKRPAAEMDMEAIIKIAARHKKILELDASADRLDLSDIHCRLAKEYGVKIVINSDAHAAKEINLSYGVATARRGWLEKEDVVNALPWEQLQQKIKR